MSLKDDLITDERVHVITKPVIGWIAAPMAGIAVLLQIQYIDSEAELGTKGKAIQFSLMPQACLDLAELLTTQANRLLESPLPDVPRQ